MWGKRIPEQRQVRDAVLGNILAGWPTPPKVGVRLRASEGAAAAALSAAQGKCAPP